VKNGIREEPFEANDVLVGDVVVESHVVGVKGSLPKFIEMYLW